MTTAVIVDAVRTAGGQAQREALGLAPRRPRRRDAQGARRAQRPRPRPRRRRDHGLRHAGRRAGRSTSAATPCSPPAGPRRCPATTIDRQCGSSQQAAHFAAQGVIAGAYDVVVAAGVEVMTPGADGRRRSRRASASRSARRSWPLRYAEPRRPACRQGISAEMIADKWGLAARTSTPSARAASSCAARATDEGRFDNEIVPVRPSRATRRRASSSRPTRSSPPTRASAPAPRSRRSAKLKPAFKPGRQGHRRQLARRSPTAPSAVLIMSEEKANAARPHARGPASTPSPWPASTRS